MLRRGTNGRKGHQDADDMCESLYNGSVEKKITVCNSFEEAEDADATRDAALSPAERIDIVVELWNRRHPDAAQQRFARVCRVVELERS